MNGGLHTCRLRSHPMCITLRSCHTFHKGPGLANVCRIGATLPGMSDKARRRAQEKIDQARKEQEELDKAVEESIKKQKRGEQPR